MMIVMIIVVVMIIIVVAVVIIHVNIIIVTLVSPRRHVQVVRRPRVLGAVGGPYRDYSIS